MSRWVYWVSLAAIAVVLFGPAWHMLTDPQADIRDLFKLGIDLEGGTSLIYELHAPEGGAAPDARAAKQVILGRIDPQGTRGYIVRAVGEHRLEIVLPGRPTKVKVTPEAVTREVLAAAQKAAGQDRAAADTIQAKSSAYLAGTRLVVRLDPPQYLEDVVTRIEQAVREWMPSQAGSHVVVGVEPSGDQWRQVAIFVPAAPTDTTRLGEWEKMIRAALESQQDVTRVKRLVRQAGFLEFRIVADKVKDRDKANFDRIIKLRQEGKPPDSPQWRWYPMKKGWDLYTKKLLDEWNFVYVVDEKSKTVEALVNVADGQDVSGRDMSRALASVQGSEPIVSFEMKATAGARFAKLTSPENRNRQMAIILDGVIQTNPSLRATLSTGGIIEGYTDKREVEEVVTVLNSGQLAASLGDPVTERTVGPELGQDNIHKGLIASLVGFTAVVLFILVYYLFAGVVANTALFLNLILTVCIMYAISQTWTLPGIAGLILSMAMAVDANVLIYERLREEQGKEGSLSFALKKAYERAFTTIFDSNLTTVIPAFVLLLPGLATEEVKGFAVVMIIGIGVSMFTAVVVTRMIFETGIRWGWVKQVRMLHFFEKPNIDWMRFAKVGFVTSVSLSVLGIILFLARSPDKYDIEFVGGTQVELALKVPKGETAVPIGDVREKVAQAFPAATVQELEYSGEPGEARISRFLVSVPASAATPTSEAGAGAPGDGKASTLEAATAAREGFVKARLSEIFAGMQPEGTLQEVQASAKELTYEDLLRSLREAPKTSAPAEKAAAEQPEKPGEAPAIRYIPDETRQYLGKTRVIADLNPPIDLGEITRRIDTYIRDAGLTGTVYKVVAGAPAGAPGQLKSFELWVRDDYTGKHLETPNPTFWTDAIRLSLARKEAFASTTSFEPTMASEAWHKAVLAILFSLAAMTVYIWFRFAKLTSGLAAVVATLHDVLITLGAVTVGAWVSDTWFGSQILDLTDFKVNLPLVGSFLTLVGYSVNDTIVVFDRIRENRGKYGDLSVSIINNSINQTLSRTVLTSSTVFIAVVALYFFGGKTSSIHGLAFVMLFGTLVGCYSSVAIASPILVLGDYLRKVYAWAYPIVGVGLLAYFGIVWEKPDVFFGSPAGWVWTILQLGWVAVATWAVACYAYGQPWPLLTKSMPLARLVGAVSLAAPLATVILFGVAVQAASGSGLAAWAGPAAAGALATLPATWIICRMVWGKPRRTAAAAPAVANKKS